MKRTLHDIVVGVAELDAVARGDRPIALFEIGDAVGERGERERVRAQEHLAVALPHRQRRALPGADQQVVLALEQKHQRKGAAHAAERGVDGLSRALARIERVGDQEGGDFGIGLGGEAIAFGGEFLAQRAEILDDAVMNHREPFAGVRMGVVLGRLAVRRPAGVADADGAVRAAARRAWPRDCAACLRRARGAIRHVPASRRPAES